MFHPDEHRLARGPRAIPTASSPTPGNPTPPGPTRNVPGTYTYCDTFNGIYSKTASGADFYEEAIFLDYGAMLTGLQPDTEYMYKVCAGGGAYSAVHYFKTAGAAEFSFIWISDFHAYAPLPGRLSNAVRAINAALAIDPSVDFIFSTGDTIAWGGSYSFWTNCTRRTSSRTTCSPMCWATMTT